MKTCVFRPAFRCPVATAWCSKAGAKGQRALVDQPEQIAYRLLCVEKRLDQSGEHISDLATAVQGLPERLRSVFVTKEVFELYGSESRDDRAGLRRDVSDLRLAVIRDPHARTRHGDDR